LNTITITHAAVIQLNGGLTSQHGVPMLNKLWNVKDLFLKSLRKSPNLCGGGECVTLDIFAMICILFFGKKLCCNGHIVGV